MKKALIAALVIMTVFCVSAFAKDGIENYSGLGVGFGFSRSTFTFDTPMGDVEKLWKTTQLVISITDFGFVEKSPVGLYIDGSFVINTNRVVTFVGSDSPVDDVFLGFTAAIGPAFKFELGKKVDLILGAGFQLYSETQKGFYDEQYTFYGLGLIAEGAYSLGKSFAVSVGISGSLFFGNRCRYIYKNHEPDDFSSDKYFEYRVIPRIMAYYVY